MSRQEQWQLTGSGPESYERFQVPSIFDPLARVFFGHVALQPGQRVLDVACGTGILARHAAPILGAEGLVVGIDINPGMLKVAKKQRPMAGCRLEWRQGDAAALPFEDASFDVVLCQQGLQFFPDRVGALREMRRVLVPGGQLALCVWQSIEHSPCNLASANALARHVGAEAARRIQAPFALGDADALGALAGEAGFHDVKIHAAVVTRRMLPPEESIPGHLASTPVGPDFAALDEATRVALVDEIGTALCAYRDPGGLAIPQGTLIALARKERRQPRGLF
jgi:SAM-dependent methyltransferase